MTTYAKDTSVSVEKSRAEIERTLQRFGASHFAYYSGPDQTVIEFVAQKLRVRFSMKLPNKQDSRFWFRTAYKRKRENTPEQAEKLWEQECRSYWRGLSLLVKAKLAAVESGITSFETEFLSHIVWQAGKGRTATTAELLLPQLEEAYTRGKLPPLLSPGGPSEG